MNIRGASSLFHKFSTYGGEVIEYRRKKIMENSFQ
jgi:hypothetical protein